MKALLRSMQLPLLALTKTACSLSVTLPSIGTYQGTTLSLDVYNNTLPKNVTAWLGVEYATQPVGGLRFARAPPAQPFNGTRSATEYGVTCMMGEDAATGFPMGEDCLTMNIYRPADVDIDEKLPVAFYIHGGAFNHGSARQIDGAAFVAKAEKPVMMVTIGYRIGIFGFPTSLAFEELGLLNLGFTDQSTAIEFHYNNIEYFGGNKSEITIMGLSAGAHSVGYHYLDVEHGDPLFSKAIIYSGGPTSRAYPNASYPLYQQQWADFLERVECDGSLNATAVRKCLLDLDVETINDAQDAVWDASDYHVTWAWQPVLGGPLIPRPATESWEQGLFNKLPLMTGFCHQEGRYYAPQNLSTEAEFHSWFRTLLPGVTDEHLAKISELYPDPTTNLSSPYVNSPLSPQFARMGAAYGDYAYICPGQNNAVSASAFGAPVWKYHFMQNNSWPAWEGIPHSCDFYYEWNAATVQSPQIGKMYHSYIVNFVTDSNPNAGLFKPEWPLYTSGVGGDLGTQLRILENDTAAEPDDMRREQCEFWRSIPSELFH